MRLFWNELSRLWGNPRGWLVLFIACFAEIAILRFQAEDMVFLYSPQEYHEAYQELEHCNLVEAWQLYGAKEIADYDVSAKAQLRRQIKKELEELQSYDRFLEEIEESAKKISSMPIFADSYGYATRNALATAEAYNQLKGKVAQKPGPSKGMELWSESFVKEILICLVMLFIVNEIVVRDREAGQMNLTFATVKGRRPHCVVKLAVCFVSSFFVTGVMLLTALITVGQLFGVGDLSRAVQSVCGFRGCSLLISLYQYIGIYFFVNSMAVFCVTLILFAVASCFSSPGIIYFFVSVIGGVEAIIYLVIKDTSYLSILRNMNIMAFLDSGAYLSVYNNVNFFGKPVAIMMFMFGSVLVCICVFIILNITIYARQKTLMDRSFVASPLLLRGGQTVSTLIHESYKFLVCGKGAILLIGLAALQLFLYRPMYEFFEDIDAVYYRDYVFQLEGEVTDSKIEWMNQERRRYEEIMDEMVVVLAKCPEELISTVSMHYQQKMEGRGGLEEVIQRAASLQKSGGYLVYEPGYALLTFGEEGIKEEITLAIMASMMMVLCGTYIFATDSQIRMDYITSVCRKGGRILFLKKFLLGCAVLFVIWGFVYLPYLYNVLSAYGIRGLDYPVQSLSHLEGSVFEKCDFSIKELVIFLFGMKYVVLLVEMGILARISQRMRSVSQSVIVFVCLFCGPLLVLYVFG